MEYPKLYLDWVKYLISKKLYGAWIKDVSTFIVYESHVKARALNENSYFMTYVSISHTILNSSEKNIFTTENIYNIIDAFSKGKEIAKLSINILAYGLKKILSTYRITNVDWYEIYENFNKNLEPELVLSRKLSKKLYRTTNKVSSNKHVWVEKQPWYNKSYEKNKLSKKAWRK